MKYKFSVATGIIAGICLIILLMTPSVSTICSYNDPTGIPCGPTSVFMRYAVWTVFLFFAGLAVIGGAVEAFMRSLGKV